MARVLAVALAAFALAGSALAAGNPSPKLHGSLAPPSPRLKAAEVKRIFLQNGKVAEMGTKVTAADKVEVQGKPILAYYYEPNWFSAKVPLVHIPLPPYTDGCDADPKKVACDYPDYILNKIVRTKFTDTGGDAATFIKNFKWANQDQNSVADAITNKNMTPEDAAKQWIDANTAKWQSWMP